MFDFCFFHEHLLKYKIFHKEYLYYTLLPGGIKQFFKSDSSINNDENYKMFSEYQDYKDGKIHGATDVEAIANYYKDADDSAKQFILDVEKGNIELKEGQTIAQAFTTKYSSGIKQLGSNILSLGKNIAATFGKAVLSAGIMWLVSEGISLVAKAGKYIYDEWLTDNGKNKRRKEAVTRLNNRLSEYSEENKALSDLVSQYESLNEKLQDENITTSEMVDTKTDLLKLQKQIKDQYGKEAEGIDFVNGKYEEQIKKLEKLERKKAAQALYDPTNGILVPKGKEKKSDYEQAVDTMNSKPKSTKFNIGGGLGIENQSANDYWGFDVEGFTKRFEGLSISKESKFVNEFGQKSTGFYLNINPEWNNKEVEEAITEYIEALETEYGNNPKVKEFKEAVTHDFKENVKYDATEYDAAEGMVDQTIRLITSTGVKGDPITQLEDTVDEYNTALAEYETTGSEDAKEKLQEAEKNLKNAENYAKNLENIDKNLFNKINNQEGGWDNYNNIIDQTLEGQSKTRDERFANKFKNANSELRALGDWAKKNLDESEFQWLESLLPEDVAALTLDDLKKLIEKAKEEAAKADIKLQVEPTISDGVSKLNALDSAFDDDLTTAYSATKSSGGEATAKEIEAVNSAFGGTTFNSTDAENINVLSNAIEAYNEDLVQNAGDSEKAQVAHNKLITAYIDQNDVLKELTTNLDDVTEEQKKYYVEQLKSQGVENAQEVVDTRLTKQYRKHVEALKSLSKYITQNNQKFKDAVNAKDTEADSIKETTSLVQDLLKVYDDTGEEVKELTPNIDPSFVIENAELIERAVSGDVDAITELRLAAAEKVLLDVSAESNLDIAEADVNSLMGLVAEADAMNIDVGASIDDSDFIATLNNMIASAGLTANQVSAAFEAMGYDVEFENKTYPVEMVNMITKNGANGMPTTVMEKMKESISFPAVKIISRKGSSGAGKSGVYNGGGGSKSSGGSGGGGGGSDSSSNDEASENSEETFDWIEVYINRIEEEIARLDKVIDDVYTNWATRNDKVTKKISKLTEEIEAQKKAAAEYEKYTENIKINDGETINADDYENGASDVQYIYDKDQYDKAVAAWATGEYQKKIKNGQMSDDDIEKIQNEYLVNAINEFTEYWNKHVAANDMVIDLEIQVKDSYKQLFENLLTEYEDQLTNLEKEADIINERITRTEEHGYFVDESYYNALIENEKSQRDKLAKELEESVNQFNDSVSKGKIQEGTEAWHDMYQQVQDVNKAYEESNTELVKLNNTVRQLRWDKFDWLEERLDDISAEAEWLTGLLQGEDNYDDKGFLNNRGFAQAALVGTKYNATLEKQQRYKKEIAKIDEQLATDEGKNDKNLIARKEELLKVYRDSISAAEEEKKAMQSLVREGINNALLLSDE